MKGWGAQGPWRGLALLALVLAPLACRAGDEERKLGAVFLGRFASYVDWPANAREQFTITLIDENPFGNLLEALYRDKRIHGKPVAIRQVRTVEEIGATDLLYITLNTVGARSAAIEYAQRHGILTISVATGFAASGGVIQLNFVEQKSRLTINHDAAMRSGLRIGAPLLSVAQVLRKEAP